MKNFLFQYLGDDPEIRATNRWEAILSELDSRDGVNLGLDDFIYYAWNSRFGPRQAENQYVVKDRLLRSVSDYVEIVGVDGSDNPDAVAKENALEILQYLRFCAKLIGAFNAIVTSSGTRGPWSSFDEKAHNIEKDSLNVELYGILLTQAQQPMVLLFALFHSYFNGNPVKISTKMLRRFLKRIHHFQFRWSIAQKSSSDSQRKLYRVAAVKVFNAKSASEIERAYQEFVDQTSGKVTDIQFTNGLEKLSITRTDKKRDKPKVRFVLSEIEKARNPHAGRKIDWTIEHIQGLADRSEKTPRNSWIFKIGNLMLLPKNVNNSLPEEFEDKADQLAPYCHSNETVLNDALEEKVWGAGKANE